MSIDERQRPVEIRRAVTNGEQAAVAFERDGHGGILALDEPVPEPDELVGALEAAAEAARRAGGDGA